MTHATRVPHRSVPDAQSALGALADRWRGSELKERQAFQTWFREFCDALGVAAPGPDGAGNYCFELPVKVLTPDGEESTNFIDCWKASHVAIEAKASGKGTNEVLLRKAYRQLTNYIAAEPGTIPPYLMVVDVPRELIVWDAWNGRFGGFAIGERVRLEQLADRADLVALLQDIFTNPAARDPRGKALQVTREIAGNLAQLAATFESRGIEPERVARFLMRCVFCFFAEDVGLLPAKLFERTLMNARTTGGPERVADVLTRLWRTMDSGGDFGADLIDRFNGHFFRSVESLPLESDDVQLLIEAAGFDWSAVEPSIFGTLLVRALDPVERHKLGAEYTPRAYIERLVEPTVLEPLRARWAAVEVRVKQLEEEEAAAAEASSTDTKPTGSGRKKKLSKPRQEALAEVQGFHAWLRGLRFLDPACGSGNFLYVTMAAVKDLELEVIREIERLGAREGVEQTEQILDEVHPRQFHGIEVSWWAREIAELTLWIGYHQFWRRAHGGRTPPIPILEDTGTIVCRDAILAWDEIVHRPDKDRPDPTPRITSPVTGELIPDPEAKLPYMEYVGARPAEWPEADFIIGNPPYLGRAMKRDALGDGYVDALSQAYSQVPDDADFVFYWWWLATRQIAHRPRTRAGFITTNSLWQDRAGRFTELAARDGADIEWAVLDHPWVDDALGAAVRVSMSVLSFHPRTRRVLTEQASGKWAVVVHDLDNQTENLRSRLSHTKRQALLANAGLSSQGYKLAGSGFVLSDEEAAALLSRSLNERVVVHPFISGGDVAGRGPSRWVIDFGLRSLKEISQYPLSLQTVIDRVKPVRLSRRSASQREFWWRFDRPRPELREAVANLEWYATTSEVSKHRLFLHVDREVAPDGSVVAIAIQSWPLFGVLSSEIHLAWTLATSGTLEDRPRYSKSLSFEPYPFPVLPKVLRDRLATLAERLDQHRQAALARDKSVTMTGMYNVVEKLRSGEALSPKERKIHEIAACGVLKDLHDELDALVAQAYGWPWPLEREEILERLVALHDERVEEEKRGVIRWLRPDYQIPRFAPDQAPETLDLGEEEAEEEAETPAERLPWPQTAVAQLEALTALVARRPVTLSDTVAFFEGADPKLVARHLETLVMLGEVTENDGRYAGGKVVA